MAKTSSWIKGFDYDRLLREFLNEGGDLSLCPFDVSSRVGSDSDHDTVLDEVWEDIQRDGLRGESPTDEDWERWERER